MDSVSYMDLQSLSAINCEERATSLVTAADGSGIYLFLYEKQSFIFTNFETGAITSLASEEFKTISGDFEITSTVLFDKGNRDSAKVTNFLGIVRETQSNMVFIALFSGNFEKTTISIGDEIDAYYSGNLWRSLRIYKSKCGKYFVLNNFLSGSSLTVQEVMMNGSGKLDFRTVAQCKQLEKPIKNLSAFVEDEAVFYFSSDSLDKLIRISIDGTQSTTIHLSSENEKFPSCNIIAPPVRVDESIFYTIFNRKVGELNIWALNTQEFCWSKRATISHLKIMPTFANSLEIMPDETAVLLYDCGECKSHPLHIYQLDLSIVGKYTLNENLLGIGGFGLVVEGTFADRGIVAVKILHDFSSVSIHSKRKMLLSAIYEAKKLKMLSHENIVEGFGFIVEEEQFLLFMELMTESVKEKILRTAQKRLEEKEALRILQQTLEGLVYLHTFQPKPIVHRDIKCMWEIVDSANILFNEAGIVKLGDLGIVKAVSLDTTDTTGLSDAPSDAVGTAYFKAPEVLTADSVYGRKADVWSIGCSLVEMLTGNPPHCPHVQPTDLAVRLRIGSITYNPHQLIPAVSLDVANILEKCFRKRTKHGTVHKNASNKLIRPHSWKILSDVIEVSARA